MKQVKIYSGYEDWSDMDLLAGMIVGEAGGASNALKAGVGLTAKTRWENPGAWGNNLREVILARKQFSCWEMEKERLAEAREQKTAEWKDCMSMAHKVFYGGISDWLGHPTHYHTDKVNPTWDDGPTMKFLGKIGNTLFFRDTTRVKE